MREKETHMHTDPPTTPHTARTGQAKHDRQNRTGQDRKNRIVREDIKDKTARTGQEEQDRQSQTAGGNSQNRTGRTEKGTTGQSPRDRYHGTGRTREEEKDCQDRSEGDRTPKTGLSGQGQ